ncbi:MAG: hypothetical protein KC636_35875 [Myxococcales bacterium]|nr:hypothetical protein [Myxococcales bacterium]
MPRTTHHYDVIVLGPDLAGLVVATLAARRDCRVLVVPHGSADRTFALGRHDASTHTAPCLGLDAAPVRRVFEELGVWQHVRRKLQPCAGGLHYALDDVARGARHRLDVAQRHEGLDRELHRACPGEPVLETLQLEAAARGEQVAYAEALLADEGLGSASELWGRRFAARHDAERPQPPTAAGDDPVARALVDVALPWLVDLDEGQLDPSARARLSERWLAGPEDFEGGVAELRRSLLARLKTHSGEVKSNLRVANLEVHRGRVTSMTFLGRSQVYGCEHVVLACDPRQLEDAVPPGLLGIELLATLDAIDVRARRFVLALEVGRDGLSPALRGIVVHRDARAPDRPIFLRVDPPSDGDTQRVLITAIVDPDAPVERLRERLLGTLDEAGILPFVHEHIVAMHSPHDGRGQTDGRGAPLDASPGVLAPMDAILARRDGAPLLGLGLLPPQTALKNLHVASRLTLPGLGLEGQFAAGYAVAGLIAAPSTRGRRLYRARI